MNPRFLSADASLKWAALFAFCVTLFLGVWKNDFPYFYHVDEPGKARQILTGERNLRHPLLLLSSVDLAMRLGAGEETYPSVTRVGRTISAAFDAGAACLLTLILGAALGPLAAWCGAFLISTHWAVFELSHYFKEDPAFCFGVMSVFAAIAWWRRGPSASRAAAMGVACALAVSGKYLGVMMLAFVVAAWLMAPPKRQFASIAAFLVAFVAVFSLINIPMLRELEAVKSSLDTEIQGVLKGDVVATHAAFHWDAFHRIGQVARTALVPGLLFFLILSCRNWRKWPLEILLLALFSIVLTFVLAFSQKDSPRYFLPAVFSLAAASALGLRDWAAFVSRRRLESGKSPWSVGAITLVTVLVVVGGAGERLLAYGRGFSSSSRDEAGKWIEANLPPKAVIAQSDETRLPDPNFPEREAVAKPFSQKIVTFEQLAQHQTVNGLRKMGITHVIATNAEWEPYVKGGVRQVRVDRQVRFDRRREFWTSLNAKAKLVWHRKSGKIGTHNPEVKIWQLAPMQRRAPAPQ